MESDTQPLLVSSRNAGGGGGGGGGERCVTTLKTAVWQTSACLVSNVSLVLTLSV